MDWFDSIPQEGLAALAASFGLLVVAIVIARRALARARIERQAGERRANLEKERAEALERDLRAATEKMGTSVSAERAVLDGLVLAFRDVGGAASHTDAASALGRAMERVFSPKQWLVFVADDAEGKEFVLAGSGNDGNPPGRVWPQGARISAQSGRIGLVARRRAAMDTRDFDNEPPIVREQVAQTEPREFKVDCAAPVLVGTRVAAVIAVGGSEHGLVATRAGMALLADQASAVLRSLDARERATRFANQDAITALGSKTWFTSAAAESLYQVRCAGGRCALVMLGIQHFPHYLRKNGQQAGDRILRGIASVIRPLVREGEMLARWSGDEFIAFLPGMDASTAALLAQRVESAVSSVAWPGAEDQPHGKIEMCAAIATFPESGETLEEMVETAAQSLAEQRSSGDDAPMGDVTHEVTSGRHLVDGPTSSATQTEMPEARYPPRPEDSVSVEVVMAPSKRAYDA